jgi:hypothetical protein
LDQFVARLHATQTIWVRIQTYLEISISGRHSKGVANMLLPGIEKNTRKDKETFRFEPSAGSNQKSAIPYSLVVLLPRLEPGFRKI